MNQAEALTILKTGRNVFLTGEPGAGKTHVLNQYIEWLTVAKIPVAVTASTGIAATHIGGFTLHAWSGIGIKDSLSAHDLEEIANKEKVIKGIRKAKVLVIDEISMLDGGVLEMVDRVVRRVKQTDAAFGGLQVVLVGDFFQLPPVARAGDISRFAFESGSWEALRPIVCYLTEQHRHTDDLLVDLLRSIRRGEVDETHYTLLGEQTDIAYEGIEPTCLYTHNIDVDAVNNRRLAAIKGTPQVFKMTTLGDRQLIKGLVKNCLSPERLELKTEAVVMCTKNNFDAGYVNGTVARVVAFDSNEGYPVIETTAGKRLTITPVSWEMRDSTKILAAINQLPLRLAWAITIHKSQGMSLDAAEIDLTKAFVYGHGYVALSRARTLAGLKVKGINTNALRVNPRVINQDAGFMAESGATTATLVGLDEAEFTKQQERFVIAAGGTMPRPGAKPPPSPPNPSGNKEDTKITTLGLLRSGRNLAQIAKERSLSPSTIWTHLEKLAASGDLTEQDITHLRSPEWVAEQTVIADCLAVQPDDSLKPVFIALGERYSYDTIRLVRLASRLANK